jgi:hypothetical protein
MLWAWLSAADGTLLARDGAVVTLAPKVPHTLLVLVQHPGEAGDSRGNAYFAHASFVRVHVLSGL